MPRFSFSAISVLLAAQLMLSACGAATATPGPNGATAPSGTVSFMVSGDPADFKAYQTVVAAFEAKYPGVTVELLHVPGTSAYTSRLNADLAVGAPADVVLLNYRRMALYASRQQLAPLTTRIAQSPVIQPADFYPQVYEAFKWEGEQMCIPQNISSLVVYYNRDLFQAAGVPEPQAGWTLEQFVDTAKQLTRDTDGDGAIDQYGLGTETTFIRLMPFIWQRGGDTITKNPMRLALNSVPASLAFQWFVDLRLVHGVVPTAEEEESESSLDRFYNGRAAMYFESRRIVPALRQAVTFDWDVAPLPQLAEAAPVNILHGDGYCIPTQAQHPDLAWLLVEFANSDAGQRIMVTTGRTVPSRISVAESAAFLDPSAQPAHSQVWLDAVPQLRALPLVPQWTDIEGVVDDEITRAFYGNASVPDAVLAAIARSEEYFVVLP